MTNKELLDVFISELTKELKGYIADNKDAFGCINAEKLLENCRDKSGIIIGARETVLERFGDEVPEQCGLLKNDKAMRLVRIGYLVGSLDRLIDEELTCEIKTKARMHRVLDDICIEVSALTSEVYK